MAGVNVSRANDPSDRTHHLVKELALPQLSQSLPENALEARIPEMPPPGSPRPQGDVAGAEEGEEEEEEEGEAEGESRGDATEEGKSPRSSRSPRTSQSKSPRKLMEMALPEEAKGRGGQESKGQDEGETEASQAEDAEEAAVVELPRTVQVMARGGHDLLKRRVHHPLPVAASSAVTPFPPTIIALLGDDGRWYVDETGTASGKQVKILRLPPFYPQYDRLLVSALGNTTISVSFVQRTTYFASLQAYLYIMERLHVTNTRRNSGKQWSKCIAASVFLPHCCCWATWYTCAPLLRWRINRGAAKHSFS